MAYPLRPISSNGGSAYHLLSHFLVEIVTQLTRKSSSYVNNSAHFVGVGKKKKKKSNAPIHYNQMLNLDVASLLTRVSTYETQTVVQDKLATDPLLEECTCIPIDKMMEMLTLFGNLQLWEGGLTHPQEGPTMRSLIPSIGQHILRILWRNGIRIYITEVINVT